MMTTKRPSFFFSFRSKKCSIKSHITSNANCDYTRNMHALSHAVVAVRPFLNATHVTNIGFYLCVFLDTTDRTRMPFAWYVNMNMFSSTQIVGFSFLLSVFCSHFLLNFCLCVPINSFVHSLVRSRLLTLSLTRLLTRFHSLSLCRCPILNPLLVDSLPSLIFLQSQIYFIRTSKAIFGLTRVSPFHSHLLALRGGSNKSTIQLFDLCVLSPFLAGIWGLTLSDATCDDNIKMMSFVQQRKNKLK